jgi:hypothetical protein
VLDFKVEWESLWKAGAFRQEATFGFLGFGMCTGGGQCEGVQGNAWLEVLVDFQPLVLKEVEDCTDGAGCSMR